MFGAWTARALSCRGWRVTLIDQHGPASSRASSGGETRIIRSSYGNQRVYTRWARDSLCEWLELERRVGETLFVRTGALFLGGDRAWLADTAETLRAEGIPVETLAQEELSTRFPQLDFPDAGGALLEPDAGALFARRAVHRLVGLLVSEGVEFRFERVNASTLLRYNTDDALIFACGAWLPAIFPDSLAGMISPTRQEVFFFGARPGDPRFSTGVLPAWVVFDEGIYGLPDLEGRGVKVAVDAHGPEADPERMDRTVDCAAIDRMREVLRRRLPALRDAPLLESRVCQYENTPDGHFLLDRLPEYDRVWICGGGSGHGFKHGPAIGRYMADLVEAKTAGDRLFGLAGRPPRRRAVY